jgi:hypothetical protein
MMITNILDEYTAFIPGGKLHSIISQKTAVFIFHAIRTPNLEQ